MNESRVNQMRVEQDDFYLLSSMQSVVAGPFGRAGLVLKAIEVRWLPPPFTADL
jgi:hypothetical protein